MQSPGDKVGEVFLTPNDLGVAVEWKIPRFLYLEKDNDYHYCSPYFHIDRRVWYFSIYPNGRSCHHTLGHLDVWIWGGSEAPVSVEVCVSLGNHTDARSPTQTLDTLVDYHGFRWIVPRREVERWFRLHPYDVLTVECTVKKLTSVEEYIFRNLHRMFSPLQTTGKGTSSKENCAHCKEDFDADSIASHRKRCSRRPVMCPDCSEVIVTQEWLKGHECRTGRTEGVARKIPYPELCRATRDFSHELGSGGFGTVFKGEMDDGGVMVQIAVKKLQKIDKQFETELNTLFSFKHEFLLSMLGYCDDPAHPCLVLEYMENGSLQDRLACKDKTPPLAWDVRLLIAYCSAMGINHLHTNGQVHRDVKTANILLDKDMFPKVADFGVVRIGERGTSGIVQVTGNVLGTPEYMAPEACYGDVSVKLDSFSFGVVLLELLTGLPSMHQKRPLFLYKNNILDMLDSKVSWDKSIAAKVHEISKRCLLEKEDRPTLSQILDDLKAVLPASVRMLCMKLASFR